MSTVRLEESFELAAAPEVVWGYLIDPAKIVVCLPGAELLSVEDERNYQGRVRVKVGAVTVSYDGTMEFVAIDDEARRVEMVGKGREKGGAGTATMTMEGRVEPHGADGAEAGEGGGGKGGGGAVGAEPSGSRVSITAEVQLTGKIVRFGRGMIGAVSKEVFSQFAACLAALVAEAGEGESASEAPAAGAAETPASTPPQTPGAASDASPPAEPQSPRAPEPEPIASAAPVSAFGLLFATLRSSVKRFFARLSGRG